MWSCLLGLDSRRQPILLVLPLVYLLGGCKGAFRADYYGGFWAEVFLWSFYLFEIFFMKFGKILDIIQDL